MSIVKIDWTLYGKDDRFRLPDINLPAVWKICLDLWWHSCDDRCVVCRSVPCIYKE